MSNRVVEKAQTISNGLRGGCIQYSPGTIFTAAELLANDFVNQLNRGGYNVRHADLLCALGHLD